MTDGETYQIYSVLHDIESKMPSLRERVATAAFVLCTHGDNQVDRAFALADEFIAKLKQPATTAEIVHKNPL